jgi:hypothetical protein
MTTFHNILAAVALVSTVVTSGCLHHPQLLPCAAGTGEEQCWQSSRSDEDGRLRHHIVERVTPGDRCDVVAVEQSSFDEKGALVQHVVEERRCRVTERRTTDRYDLAANEIVRTIEIDRDHDDQFDTMQTLELPMTSDDRLFAMTTSVERFASLAEARDRASWKSPRAPKGTHSEMAKR